MKKTLLIIGLILVALIVVGFVVDQRTNPLSGNLLGLKKSPPPLSTYDTAKSYYLDENGAVVTGPASSRLDLRINGSDQPLITKAPFSFTLSWKIDPAIDISDCDIDGPNIRAGYSMPWASNDEYTRSLWLSKTGTELLWLKSEGSLSFENVVPGEYKSAPLYNGVASFRYHEGLLTDNQISIECSTDAGFEAKGVTIRIDR